MEEAIGGSNYRIRKGGISRAPSEICIPGNNSPGVSCVMAVDERVPYKECFALLYP